MLSEVGAGIWEAVQPLRVAGFELGHRMTVVRLATGDLAVHSPIAYSTAVARDVQALGPVKWIIAPNAMHDLYLREWMNGFTTATLLHSPALKVKSFDSRRTQPLGREPLDGLQPIPIDGMPRLQEFVFHHPASNRLIVADLVFNLPPGRGLQKWLQKASGIYERLGPSKFFKTYISHNEAFARSIQEILALKVERLIVGHGSNVSSGAHEHLTRAFSWLRLSPETG